MAATTSAPLKRAALCIGVGRHTDPRLSSLPQAVETARDVAKALEDHTLFSRPRLALNPPSTLELFDLLQKTLREARGGAVILYFAGFVLERGKELLLAVQESDAATPSRGVPWGDVEDILKREGVARALVIFNAQRLSGGPFKGAIQHPSVFALGALRKHDDSMADAHLREYADVLIGALRNPAADVESFLTDGMLDADGLERCLAARAAKDAGHARLRALDGAPTAIRDLRSELAKLHVAREAPKAAPVVEAKEAAPLAEAKYVAPVIEAPKADPVVEAPKVAPVVEAKPAEPIVEAKPEPVVEPVVEAAKPEPIAEPKPEPIVEAPKVEPIVEEPAEERAPPVPSADAELAPVEVPAASVAMSPDTEAPVARGDRNAAPAPAKLPPLSTIVTIALIIAALIYYFFMRG